MRRAAVPLPPEEIWLGEPWEDAPARRRASDQASALEYPTGVGYRSATRHSSTASRESAAGRNATLDQRRPPVDGARRAVDQRRPPVDDARTAVGHRGSAVHDSLPPTRRTVMIRGRGAEGDLTRTSGRARPRSSRPAHERPSFKPDRAAMWAVVLGLLLVLVAATSSHAAVRAPSAAAARMRDGAAPAARAVAVPAAATVRATAVTQHRA